MGQLLKMLAANLVNLSLNPEYMWWKGKMPTLSNPFTSTHETKKICLHICVCQCTYK